MKIIASIEDPEAILEMLKHFGLVRSREADIGYPRPGLFDRMTTRIPGAGK